MRNHLGSFANAYCYRYVHAYRNPHCYPHPHGNTNSYSHSDGNAYSYSYADANSEDQPDANRFTYIHTNGNCLSYPEGHGDVNSNRISHSYSHCVAGRLCLRPRLLENPCRVASEPVAAWQRHL